MDDKDIQSMKFPDKREFSDHSRSAQFKPKEYIQHVNHALRSGKNPKEGNYFIDIYNRALRYIKIKEGEGPFKI